jgi:uncharacterized protein (UPF0218 family)
MKYRPTDSQIQKLKRPLGELVVGNPTDTMKELAVRVKKRRYAHIATVGDVVSQAAVKAGIPVHLRIIDHKTMRKEGEFLPQTSLHTFDLTNPAGVITDESFSIIREAMSQPDALIIVDGEEDLLTIPTVLESPNNSIVVYGQPMEGLVIITVDQETKETVNNLLQNMNREEE